MKVLGIRYCAVSEQAGSLAEFLDALGLERRSMNGGGSADGPFDGAVFPAGSSWIELWPTGEGMPAGTMLQVVVDDADAFARHARGNGLDPQGPVDAHGERIYYVEAPAGLSMSFQSTRPQEPQ